MNPPSNPTSKLNDARNEARRVRAEWLIALDQGVVSLADLLDAAREDRRLGVIHLRQALAAQPGWSLVAANRAVTMIKRWDPQARKLPHKKLDLRWVVGTPYWHDHMGLLADALVSRSKREAPCPQFPYGDFLTVSPP